MKGCLALLGAGFFGLVALVVIGSVLPEDPDKDRFDETAAEVFCEDPLKQLLRDPDSYRFESASILRTYGEGNKYGLAVISYRARNGFGGYVAGTAQCRAYDKDGTRWFKVQLEGR